MRWYRGKEKRARYFTKHLTFWVDKQCGRGIRISIGGFPPGLLQIAQSTWLYPAGGVSTGEKIPHRSSRIDRLHRSKNPAADSPFAVERQRWAEG